jgi:hypothetical protein
MLGPGRKHHPAVALFCFKPLNISTAQLLLKSADRPLKQPDRAKWPRTHPTPVNPPWTGATPEIAISVWGLHRNRLSSIPCRVLRSQLNAPLALLKVSRIVRDTFFTKRSCGKIEIAQLSIASG